MADRTWTGRVLIKGEKKGVSSAFSGAEKNVQGLSKSLKKLGTVVGIAGVGALFADTARTIKVFEKSISDLSAITGATGKDLDRLAAASKRIGQTTTLSASQAAEAFKLMASAKPDLLSNLDALEATTAAAVTLAEAAGLELPAATSALGESLNQFGASADQATKFINVLAAGAKFGSSEINETSLALKNAGTVANQAGLSFETTNAAIQGLAAGGLKGAEAGSKLRAVLLKLQVQADDRLNPKVVGLTTALDNLADANLSVTDKVKLFGLEAVATADLLVAQRDTVAQVESAVTGTSEAYSQAKARTDNLDGSIKRLSSAFEAVQLSFSNTSGAMRILVDGVADIFNAVSSLNSESSPGSISLASTLFSGLALSLKTTFTAGVVLKNMFDSVLDVLGFVAKAIVRLLERDFKGVKDDFANLKMELAAEFEDVGEFAARTFNPELAAKVDENMRTFFKEPTVAVAQETAAAVADVALTAGKEAEAVAAELAAEKLAKEEEREALRIERIRASNLTDREAAVEHLLLKNAQNAELLELGIITDDQFNERRVLAAQDTADKIIAIDKAKAASELTFAKMSAKAKTAIILGEATRLTQGVATSNKTLFKINKAAAIAQAAVALPAAVIESYKNAGGYPFGIIPAALMAATGLAQIQAIKSTTFGGGGTGTTPSAAGSAPTINNIPTGGGDTGGLPAPFDVSQGGGAAAPGQRVNIQIDGLDEGGLLSIDQVRRLMGSISEQLGDGVEIDTGG